MDLTLGLSNGSMQQPTLDLLSKIGLEIRFRGRNSRASLAGLSLFDQVILMRPQDIPTALMQSHTDCGICGLDWIVETELDPSFAGPTLIRIKSLPYSRAIRQPVTVILFGRPDSPPLGQGSRISSEFPNLTHKHCPNADISFSHGSTEIKVALGQFDYGVAVTETGASLLDNDLIVYEELLVSPMVLIAREPISQVELFGELLEGALKAEQYQLIKMNMGRKIRDHVLQILPALKAPTINELSDRSWAVETIVQKARTAELLIRLRTLGATDILVQDLNAILA